MFNLQVQTLIINLDPTKPFQHLPPAGGSKSAGPSVQLQSHRPVKDDRNTRKIGRYMEWAETGRYCSIYPINMNKRKMRGGRREKIGRISSRK